MTRSASTNFADARYGTREKPRLPDGEMYRLTVMAFAAFLWLPEPEWVQR